MLQGFDRILAGEFFVPSGLSTLLQDGALADVASRPLSPRLQQVQELLLRGTPNKLISRSLSLSDHTVKEYVSSVLTYHGVANRLELVLKLGHHRPH